MAKNLGTNARDVFPQPSKEDSSKVRNPRVLIKVCGGVAYYVADEGVDVVIFDNDDFNSDPIATEKPPAYFADLADQIGAPINS